MASRNAILNALRKQQDMARQRVGRARSKSVPMPVGGWNTRDSNTRIGPQFAEEFTNVISSRDGIHPRQNPVVHATLEAASLEPYGLMVHNGTDGVDKMFAVASGAAGNSVWDVSTGGAKTPGSIQGLSSPTVNSANVNGRLVCATGSDDPFSYDGSVWSLEPMSVAAGSLATDQVENLYPFKNRVFWWRSGELGFWYSTLNTIGDALRYFDLSYVAREGGDLLTMTRYTHDGGSGPDDYPIFITSRGEALIYQGTNPDAAATWAFVGSFRLGKPPQTTSGASQYQTIAATWGASSWLITEQDYVALPQALLTEGNLKPTLLSGALQDEMNAHQDKEGWQAIVYPNGPWLMFNIPQGSETYVQHMIDLHTGAPSKFTGMNATSWAEFNGDMYYAAPNPAGATGNKPLVYKAFTTSTKVDIRVVPGASNLGIDRAKIFNGYRVWASTSANGRIPATASATTRLRTNYTDGDWTGNSILRYNEWVLTGGAGTYVQFRIDGPSLPGIELKHVEYIWETGDALISAQY